LRPACAAGELGSSTPISGRWNRGETPIQPTRSFKRSVPARSICTGVTSRSSASVPRRMPNRIVLPALSAMTRSSSSQ